MANNGKLSFGECPNCGSQETEINMSEHGKFIVCKKCSVILGKFDFQEKNTKIE